MAAPRMQVTGVAVRVPHRSIHGTADDNQRVVGDVHGVGQRCAKRNIISKIAITSISKAIPTEPR